MFGGCDARARNGHVHKSLNVRAVPTHGDGCLMRMPVAHYSCARLPRLTPQHNAGRRRCYEINEDCLYILVRCHGCYQGSPIRCAHTIWAGMDGNSESIPLYHSPLDELESGPTSFFTDLLLGPDPFTYDLHVFNIPHPMSMFAPSYSPNTHVPTVGIFGHGAPLAQLPLATGLSPAVLVSLPPELGTYLSQAVNTLSWTRDLNQYMRVMCPRCGDWNHIGEHILKAMQGIEEALSGQPVSDFPATQIDRHVSIITVILILTCHPDFLCRVPMWLLWMSGTHLCLPNNDKGYKQKHATST